MIRLGQAAILGVCLICSACVLSGPPAVESNPPNVGDLAVAVEAPPDLDPADARLFGRLRAHIDARVETKLVNALDEAAEDGVKGGPRSVVAGAVASAIVRIVWKCIKAAIAAALMAALLAFLWKNLWWVGGLFVLCVVVVAAPVSWFVSRVERK